MVLRTSGTIVDVGQALRFRFDDSESPAPRGSSSRDIGCGPVSAGNASLASAARRS
jgi:hypothetical protein